MKPKDYESTVMRMAGNIAGGLVNTYSINDLSREEFQQQIATHATLLARAIVAEVQRTAPDPPKETL